MQRKSRAPIGSWVLAGGAAVLLAAACASGPQNLVVTIPAYVAGATAAAGARGTVRLDPAKDARRESVGALVGERTTVGNVSLGSVQTNPPPVTLVTGVIRSELGAMGFGVGDTGDTPRVSAQLVKFQIATPATALYWDINGEIELDLAATGKDRRKHETHYAVQCTGRTYAWPGEEVIGGVIVSCLKELGGKVRSDTALGDTLGAG
ncbi:MAG TPA: hypothetical protein VMG60_20850 [Burkholderiaceae bacterium]|nr:hypothetical protein [Burkholderiaceae bacterium]